MYINHIAVYVHDLEAAKTFFVRYFGGTPNRMYHNPRTGLRTYFLTFDDGARLEIMQRPDINPDTRPTDATLHHEETETLDTRPADTTPDTTILRHGYTHLAFSVGSKQSVDALTRQLADSGYEVLSGPRTTGDGYYESVIRAFENLLLEITV